MSVAFFPDYFRLTVGFNGPVVLHLQGELDLGSAPVLGDALTALVESGETTIVIDAAALTFMDSSGLHELIRVQKAVELVGGAIRVVNQNEQLLRLFEVSGLGKQFPDPEAIGHLSRISAENGIGTFPV